MRLHLRDKQHRVTVDFPDGRGVSRVALAGAEHQVETRYLDASTMLLILDGRRYLATIAHRGAECLVAVGGETYTFVLDTPASAHAVDMVATPEITAPMPGKILQVLVRPGDQVVRGDALLILEAMKMETRLAAEAAGTVTAVRVTVGDMVDGGQILVVLQYAA